MSKIKSVITGLGVVAGLGVAVLPLTTYADDPVVDYNPNQVTATIGAAISMKLISSGSGTTDPDDALICQEPVRDSGDPQNPTPSCTGEDQYVSTMLDPSDEDKTSMYTDIYVSTNSLGGYVLTMTDSDNDNNLRIGTTDTVIASINSEPVATTNPGWAIHIDGDVNAQSQNVWRQVPLKNGTPIEIKRLVNPTAPTSLDHSKVFYGVATASDQATGIYQDTVTYTATTL